MTPPYEVEIAHILNEHQNAAADEQHGNREKAIA